MLLALLTSTSGSGAKRKPTREQPHVVLEGRDLNTFETPEFHSDPRFVSFGADTPHQFIVQLKEPAIKSKQQIGNVVSKNKQTPSTLSSSSLLVTQCWSV